MLFPGCANAQCSQPFTTLPVAFVGSSSRNCTYRGTLKPAICRRLQWIILGPEHVGLRTKHDERGQRGVLEFADQAGQAINAGPSFHITRSCMTQTTSAPSAFSSISGVHLMRGLGVGQRRPNQTDGGVATGDHRDTGAPPPG
jgi:hypothetical protein